MSSRFGHTFSITTFGESHGGGVGVVVDGCPPRLALSPEAMEILVSAPWPGNVRQLLNVIEQAVALAATEVIPESLVRQALDVADTALTPLDEARRAFERDYLVRILKITGGNVTRAARLAGRNRTEFYRLLERHSLEPTMFKVA